MAANYLAPIGRPSHVLDVGCGTGQWAYELSEQFPNALVVGLDLEPSKPIRPDNYRFVRANLLHGLPFLQERFDFVHQRLLATSGVPLKSWSAVVDDLVRVTRPGGWLELAEARLEIESPGPATAQLVDFARRLGRSLGLDTTGLVVASLDDHLRRAGLEWVRKKDLDLPVGEWGGQVGSLLCSDVRAAFTRLCEASGERFGVSADDCASLLRAMQQECDEYQSKLNFAVAFGQKPG
jgi:SAM-dependent methyltransferase